MPTINYLEACGPLDPGVLPYGLYSFLLHSKALLIALSHPLTINGGPGFSRRASGKKEAETKATTTAASPCFYLRRC